MNRRCVFSVRRAAQPGPLSVLCAAAVMALLPSAAAAQASAGPAVPQAASTPAAAPASASAAPASAQVVTVTVTVTGNRGRQPVDVAGFGDIPLSQLPLSASVISRSQLADAGISSLADITRLDADITDSYNAPGYINQLAVRGFTLDNRFNFRRDGLPINAETVIGQANKQALEVIKGTSGLQAGTSAPGGLVNFVVKRPQGRLAEAQLAVTGTGGLEAGLDVGGQGTGGSTLGWRLNAQATQLRPATRSADGSRHLLALATEAQLGRSLWEAEVEHSRQSQPSTPGFSLLGDRLPAAGSVDPRTNLNNQAWSLPVVFDGLTGSLRWTYTLPDAGSTSAFSGTQLQAHLMQQRLHTDDRIAFPFGCSADNRWDRYCGDGSMDLYDFRSEGERRHSTAAQLKLSTRLATGTVVHRLSAGVLQNRLEARFNRQAYNWVGTGLVDGSAQVPADPTLTDENTHRTERSQEWFVQDAATLSPALTAWAGARHSRLDRRSVRTDGSRATAYEQGFTTPWLALSWSPPGSGWVAYGSWGKGIESEVTPNRARYVSPGQALPALESRQVELGLRRTTGAVRWKAAWFDIRRPVWSDVLLSTGRVAPDSCANDDRCERRADGFARHRGLEAEAEAAYGPFSLRGSALWLQARRDASVDSSLNGLRPTNVPERSLKLQAAWNLAQVPGLSLLAFATHEGSRAVLPDNSVVTPGWTRIDLGARWALRWQGHPVVARVGVDNVSNRLAWQESPYQYGHAYLYPMAPRSWRASVEARF
ncbi:MAG: TonB-dependent receptor [Rubrivivax sp.]|nr:TonB-dependent receptor [Rubrivivax sp.]